MEYILENQKCKQCGGNFSIISRHHFESPAFPWRPFCSDVCEDEHKASADMHCGEYGTARCSDDCPDYIPGRSL